ncbi:holin [Exiguobacterium sp. SH5S4]|uniref:holin n=1 Tax=Exiguobacterium sp. SH5S4 TaxID=2510961 RepID=UPI001039147C|nr:holin [Exiguobacterium sp. SH5S4]TCI25590.1 holin [Exiguobacterium sp. SH5S4]
MEYPTELLLLVTLIAPVIVGLNEVAKQSINIPKNLVPLVALFIGILVGIAAAPFTTVDIYVRIWAGAIAGLTSTGLYEVGKQREGHTKE